MRRGRTFKKKAPQPVHQCHELVSGKSEQPEQGAHEDQKKEAIHTRQAGRLNHGQTRGPRANRPGNSRGDAEEDNRKKDPPTREGRGAEQG